MSRLCLPLLFALSSLVYAEKPPARNDQVIVVAKNSTAADIPVKTTEIRSIISRVNKALEKYPDDSKARVLLRSIYSNHPDHDGMQAYPHAIVPLDEEGRPHGIERFYGVGAGHGWMFRELPWEHGIMEGEEKAYERNVLKTIIPWRADKVEGVRKTLYRNGRTLIAATYKNGLANGPTYSYDNKGNVTREANLKDGKRHGNVREFWPGTKQIKREIQYDMGRVVGVMKEFYSTGAIKKELPFKDNMMHGVEVQYEADGTVRRKKYWLEGDTVSAKVFGAHWK
jgi:antitoxin component YwqK of YwqJK toxin-antitoxin module